jgi:spermidine/putrescine transport system ATP-binding protein
MSRAIVTFENVSKAYGAVMVVENLSLSVEAGQFVTLLGPSGCGKSTTLRMLGGFEDVTSGRILVDGVDVTRIAPERRNTNMVFQDYALFPHMTVRQNIAFGLERKGIAKSLIEARVNQLLDMLRIASFAQRRPEALSGGQRQRVALGRALAPDPSVVLLDEPLAALDAKLRSEVQVELKLLQKQTGKTFIFVTHDQDEALTMSDRVIVMRDGRIEQDGTPREIYRQPRTRFVADFIGETNLLDGRVIATQTGVALDWHGMRIPLQPGPQPGDAGAISIRPEALALVDDAARPAAIEGDIAATIYRGDHQLIALRVGDAAKPLNLRIDGRHDLPQVGQRLRLACAPEDVVWLGAS